MDYESLPTSADLIQLSDLLGYEVSFGHRIKGGQSATTDVLVGPEGQNSVLRRHGRWSVGFDDGIAEREEAVLAAVRASDIPAPRVV
ncbi:MAG: hypothetical protein QNL12_02395, partial [Acidimicrobiia bacterium]|nr:hypothetical protein [Acidimicrobiia bacterium]